MSQDKEEIARLKKKLADKKSEMQKKLNEKLQKEKMKKLK